jgi:Clostripain family
MYVPKKSLLQLISLISLFCTQQYTIGEESVVVFEDEFATLVREHENDEIFMNESTEEELLMLRAVNPRKPMTIIIYIAADNDLHPFAWKNIKQMESIGSNENVNVLVQLNTPGYNNPTKRYVIKHGKRLLVPADGIAPTQKLNSGSPQTLIDCAAWAMQYYPADNLVINLWDHGSGVYDPGSARIVKSSDLFRFNTETNMLELNRIGDYNNMMTASDDQDMRQNGRGICFDDTFKSYISNQDLKFALSEIQTKVLGGKKIGVLWFDACLMAMLEIADLCKDHVDYLVGSEEVEYASGSNYEMVLRPFIDRALSPRELACHIVSCFEKAYQNITRDYTQSAMDLSLIGAVEDNVNLVATQLYYALQDQRNGSVTKLLQQCKTRPFCTCFEEPTYIDLRNFYVNLQANLTSINLNNYTNEATIKYALQQLLTQGINLINNAVIANKVGSNQQRAGGISIYFPERGMFNSYPKCNFAKTNNWSSMIIQYLISKK